MIANLSSVVLFLKEIFVFSGTLRLSSFKIWFKVQAAWPSTISTAISLISFSLLARFSALTLYRSCLSSASNNSIGCCPLLVQYILHLRNNRLHSRRRQQWLVWRIFQRDRKHWRLTCGRLVFFSPFWCTLICSSSNSIHSVILELSLPKGAEFFTFELLNVL